MNILDYHVNQMNHVDFLCACGKHHSMQRIAHIAVEPGAINRLPEILAPFQEKTVFLFGDQNTKRAAGERVETLLVDAGFRVKSLFLTSGADILIPDEGVLGQLFLELDESIGALVGVGAGSLNDLGDFISARTGLPFCIVCTAPSMDGYASDTAALMSLGFKRSYPATLPYAIVGDIDILKNAPARMIQAGIGDVLGKVTALLDWRLSAQMTGEYYCETTALLVEQAVKRVIAHIDHFQRRDEEAVSCLMDALIRTGVAMALVGNSRPASGAEHQMSHYLEMDFIARGLHPDLHGIKVGASTPIVAELFEMLKDDLPASLQESIPRREEMEALLQAAGAPVSFPSLHVERELFHNCLLHSYRTRTRYSIFSLAIEKGKLETCAEAITARVYGT
ncbi:sn-glycerol-1-phosphate dehydrogenase [Christensenellaceae bacterium OttesenSCG-928-L17]|nr:sn-glycerol-1-phosphate dehydrogenase [Christensenellaceae bacterium OttesenSCG-928-L17]